ncbi:MAG: DmsC/YnfH family molybdoenzyme membrane anchor subunit [Planctomycetota bacterium]
MPSLLPPPESTTTTMSLTALVEELLREQQALSAVENFSQQHATGAPSQERYYRSLLPSSPPGPGEQYAFEVDLDCCSGCKACVTACHSLNGLAEGETFRDVGLLIGGTSTLPVLQHVTAACHHCVEPACQAVCPTLAYDKDPLTGIVKHLDDQCFGCQYCILACPYEVPQYNARKGIVRKCDMCSSRLKAGEAPACVQACPHQAIAIRLVKVADVAADCEANSFLPGAPDPQLTLPTTNYKTAKSFPRNMLPADYYAAHAAHAHLPLIAMLVLTQLSVGALWVRAALSLAGLPVVAALEPLQAISALLFGLVASGAATLHLGRPHLAYRAVLGLRKSWLSREIVAFGVFSGLASLEAARTWLSPQHSTAPDLLGWGVLISGFVGVFCSVMIYHCTRRSTWIGPRTFLRFFGSTLWLGLSTTLLVAAIVAGVRPDLSIGAVLHDLGAILCPALMLVAGLKLAYEACDLLQLLDRQHTPLKRSASLLVGELASFTATRYTLGILGGLVLPAVLWHESSSSHPAEWISTVAAMWLFSVAGETLERALFFMAAAAPRMPGGLKT